MSDLATVDLTGGCLCGAVRYRVTGAVRPIIACHCGQCQKWSGHTVAATKARLADVSIEGEDSVSWFRSSDQADRGFCKSCGSNLFWRPVGGDTLSIMAGTLDGQHPLMVAGHIYVADKQAYDEIAEGTPQFDGHHGGALPDLPHGTK